MNNRLKFCYVFLYICCIFCTASVAFSADGDAIVTTGNICIGDINNGIFQIEECLSGVEIEPSDYPESLMSKILSPINKYVKDLGLDVRDMCVYWYKIGDDLVEDIYKEHITLEKSKFINADLYFVLSRSCQNKIVLKYNMQEFDTWQKNKILEFEDYVLRRMYVRQSCHKTFSYLHKQIFDYILCSFHNDFDMKPEDITIYINSIDESNKVNDSQRYITGEDEIIIVFSDNVVRTICKDDFTLRIF